MSSRLARMLKLPILAATLAASSAYAHDLWLQPSSFQLPRPGRVPIEILIGHGQNRENWGIRSDRLILLRSLNPAGRSTDFMPLVRPGSNAPSIALPFGEAGTHMVVMQSNQADSSLPAARFNDYLQQEGLTPAIARRQAMETTQSPGRELYSRRSKTLIQVGTPDAHAGSVVTRRLGLTLEIVPERNPYLVAPGHSLPVRVYYRNAALPGALVKLTNLDADATPVATARTDRQGRARFTIPRRGKWLVNVVWTTPLSGNPQADYSTTFSSLTFG